LRGVTNALNMLGILRSPLSSCTTITVACFSISVTSWGLTHFSVHLCLSHTLNFVALPCRLPTHLPPKPSLVAKLRATNACGNPLSVETSVPISAFAKPLIHPSNLRLGVRFLTTQQLSRTSSFLIPLMIPSPHLSLPSSQARVSWVTRQIGLVKSTLSKSL
jgi:hypothetical protein